MTAATRVRRYGRRLSALAALAALSMPASSGAATPPAVPVPVLPGDWYVTEVIVFQRRAVSLPGIDERLVETRPRYLPRAITSLVPPARDRAVVYSADPAAPFCRLVAAGVPDAGAGTPEALTRPLTPPPVDAATAPAPDSASPDPAAPVDAAPPTPDALFQQALAAYAESIREQSLAWLPESSHGLAREAGRLAAEHEILLHRRWIQSVPARNAPRPIYVQAGNAGDGPALEGVLQLTRGRYLHFDVELWYRDAVLAATPDEFVVLGDSRRMRRGELHYLDHPKLGVLVRSVPVTLSAELVAAHAALAVDPLPPDEAEPPEDPDLRDPGTLLDDTEPPDADVDIDEGERD